ncbi:hypothetical protein EYF80_040617 [Liparis tanakae]|uniref:Uncharacterized protein n=1 Tax=Liparis tanakae TaxID=230148 RepID=A0A4Z2G6K8_9TELE|nr:hypothetical protein EYF80_040617 [Liparis tanakae]
MPSLHHRDPGDHNHLEPGVECESWLPGRLTPPDPTHAVRMSSLCAAKCRAQHKMLDSAGLGLHQVEMQPAVISRKQSSYDKFNIR